MTKIVFVTNCKKLIEIINFLIAAHNVFNVHYPNDTIIFSRALKRICLKSKTKIHPAT